MCSQSTRLPQPHREGPRVQSEGSHLFNIFLAADDEEEDVGREESAHQAPSHAELSRARQHAVPPPDGRGGMQTAAQRPAASSRESLTRLMQVQAPLHPHLPFSSSSVCYMLQMCAAQ